MGSNARDSPGTSSSPTTCTVRVGVTCINDTRMGLTGRLGLLGRVGSTSVAATRTRVTANAADLPAVASGPSFFSVRPRQLESEAASVMALLGLAALVRPGAPRGGADGRSVPPFQ